MVLTDITAFNRFGNRKSYFKKILKLLIQINNLKVGLKQRLSCRKFFLMNNCNLVIKTKYSSQYSCCYKTFFDIIIIYKSAYEKKNSI